MMIFLEKKPPARVGEFMVSHRDSETLNQRKKDGTLMTLIVQSARGLAHRNPQQQDCSGQTPGLRSVQYFIYMKQFLIIPDPLLIKGSAGMRILRIIVY